eukprot:9175931-Pyramimonas_sp.AAC.1
MSSSGVGSVRQLLHSMMMDMAESTCWLRSAGVRLPRVARLCCVDFGMDYHQKRAITGQTERCRPTTVGYHELLLGDGRVVERMALGFDPADLLCPG